MKNEPRVEVHTEHDAYGSPKARKIVNGMEKARLMEYATYIEHPWKLLGMNFLMGLARGLGSTLGLALVLGLVVFILQQLILLNLPGISSWLADFITNIKAYM